MYKKIYKTYTFEYFSSNPFICNHYKFKSDQEYEERINYYKKGYMKNKLSDSNVIKWKKKANSSNNTKLKDKYSELLKNFMKTKIKNLPQVITKNISVVCMFKYEDHYLLEWLYYYIMHGINHFYLYSNENTENTFRLLKPFIDKGYITYIIWNDDKLQLIPKSKRRKSWNDYSSISLQNLAFIDFVKNYKNDTKWIIKVDVDEFIYLSDNNLFIKDILNNTEKNYFSVPRFDFGNNGYRTKPSGLIIDNYTKSEEESSSSKAIALTKFISSDDKGGAHNFKMI